MSGYLCTSCHLAVYYDDEIDDYLHVYPPGSDSRWEGLVECVRCARGD